MLADEGARLPGEQKGDHKCNKEQPGGHGLGKQWREGGQWREQEGEKGWIGKDVITAHKIWPIAILDLTLPFEVIEGRPLASPDELGRGVKGGKISPKKGGFLAIANDKVKQEADH